MISDVIDFVCRETLLHLRRERLIAIATVSTVAVLFLVLGAIVLFLLNVRLWTERMAQELEVSAYFTREVARADALAASREIAAWPEVQSAVFVPKEEGWKWLQERLAGSVNLRGLDNPLPDKVCVRVRDPELVGEVAEKLEGVDGVQDVVPSAAAQRAPGSFAKGVLRLRRAVTLAGIIVSVLVAVAGIFIVHNTVRLALHARWREIYIMQLVGATRAVVAAPFLLEGAVHGLLGAAGAACLLVPTHMYLRSLSAHSAPFFFLAPDSMLLPFSLYLLLAGAVLGLTGSIASLRRFLRRRPEWHG